MTRHRQTYRLMSKHRAFLDALYDLETAMPGLPSIDIAEIVAHTAAEDNEHEPISPHTARRLSEGLTGHGYVERVAPGRYRLTEKGRADSVARGPQDTGEEARRAVVEAPSPGGIAGGVMDGTYDTPHG